MNQKKYDYGIRQNLFRKLILRIMHNGLQYGDSGSIGQLFKCYFLYWTTDYFIKMNRRKYNFGIRRSLFHKWIFETDKPYQLVTEDKNVFCLFIVIWAV